MKNQQYKKDNIEKNVENYLEDNAKLLKSYKLGARLVINFSPKQKTPLLSRIAIWIVSKQGGRLDMQFGEVKK